MEGLTDSWVFVDDKLDRTFWHPDVTRFYDYWRKITPPGRLPGRQHFDPLDIALIMPRVWMLDVVQPGPRFRYRMAGTMEVDTLGMDPTGRWLDEVHDAYRTRPDIASRYVASVVEGRPTYRFGKVTFVHNREHRFVQNMILPFAQDGKTVDLLMILSIMFQPDGVEVK